MKEDQYIDKIFKQKLGDAVDETQYREDDWNALEQLLDKGKKRRAIVYWIPVLTSVAALLLIVLGWWLFKPQATYNNQLPQKPVVKAGQPNKPPINNSGNEGLAKNATQPIIANTPQTFKGNNTMQQIQANTYFKNSGKKGNTVNSNTPVVILDNNTIPVVNSTTTLTAVTHTTLKINTAPTTANVSAKSITNDNYAKVLAMQRAKTITTSNFNHPQYALTFMGAPDINGVNSFQQTKTGTNIGLLFSATFNKITVTTGAAYSFKPYPTTLASYTQGSYGYKTNAANVLAECRMLDIPLNIDYQFFSKNQNKISVGTGLSSYIMLKETYNYQYTGTATGPSSYTVPSPGKYFLSVLNLQATYKRQVNAKVGISVQPYLKIPLGEVGASQVRLQSAGVAVGLSWNINSLTKQ